MRIHIITTETFPYGLAATQRIRCYAKSIVSLGHDCEVLCVNRNEDPNNPLGNTQPSGEIDGYRYRYMNDSTQISYSWNNKIYQLQDALKLMLAMLFSFNKKDIAIIYSYNPLIHNLVTACSKIKRFRVYVELNEHPSVHRRLFKVSGETSDDLIKIKRRLNRVDGVLCISTALRELLIKSGIPDKRIHLVSILVDSSRFNDVMKQDAEPFIGYCGAADNNKDGVDQLIKAFSKIHERYPDFKLFIIGPKAPNSNNEDLVRELSIEESVVFTGMISSDLMPQMLKNASVLALARPQSIQAKYGFPTKIGEYLLTGNPVVVTAVGDIPSFLKDEESAYLVEPDNIDAFAAKLDYVLSHYATSKRVGLNGREVAMKHFSSHRIKSQLKVAMNL